MKTAPLMIVILAMLTIGATGCSTAVRTATGAADRAYDRIGEGVDAYCEAPADRRALIRGRVNDRTGAVVAIQCPGDPNGDALPEGMRPQ